jgi:hypothetical protein
MGALGGPPPHARLTRIPRWSLPNLRDTAVTAAVGGICFGGPILCALGLQAARPTRRSRRFVSSRTAASLWLTAEAAWFVHRWYLRVSHEPWHGLTLVHFSAQPELFWSGSRFVSSL